MVLSDYLIDINYSIIDAMRQINKNARGIVYVLKDGKLLGVITDGDIRRFLLDNGDINDSVLKIINFHPQFLKEGEEDSALEQMRRSKIRSLPVINSEKEILRIIFDYEILERKKEVLNRSVVIMAGGKGTRLYPYTQILPKPLIPIGEKTITEHIMERFEEYGCSHFDMIVNYKKNFIKSYFLDNENAYDVDFIEEKEFLGTGGGLKLLEGRYQETFFMTNCDILIEEDYAKILEYHQNNHNMITMVCAQKNMVIPYGIVETSDNGNAVCLKEKPEFSFITNTGFYVIEPEFLDMIPDNTFIHITDVIQNCIDAGKSVGVFTISEDKWLDMGQMEEMEKMKKKLNL